MTIRRCPYASLIVLGAFTSATCGTARHEATSSVASKAPPTFNRDIAPIVFGRCSPCHRSGQAAPFALLSYQDVYRRARLIADVTGRRYMPPWLPVVGHGEFAGERRLEDDQIEMIRRWVADGAVEGEPADLPKTPTWTSGWQLGQPDMVVQMPRAYILRADGPNVFRNFVLPLDLPSSRFVRAVELRPNNPTLVHHAMITVDRTRASRRRDGMDGTPGFAGMFSEGSQSPDGRFLAWTPGRGPIVEPADMSWSLERGSDVVVQLHLLPSGKPETVQVSVGLFFTDTPPAQRPLMIRLGQKAIAIPAGEHAYTTSDSFVLPVDVDVLSVYPHAHYLARELQGTAKLPDGTTQWLIHIRQWDFNWQQDYRYKAPLTLPRGTTIAMKYAYDNSDGNVSNPNHPPREVLYGPQSSDEMGDLWLQVLPHSVEDAALLSRTFLNREMLANVAAGEMLVRLRPSVSENQVFLGSSYLQVGRVDEATDHLEQAVRDDPRNASAHNYLGAALSLQGRMTEAIATLQQAVKLDPRDDGLHFNLANALNANRRWDEAIREFQTAIAINPESAEAHNNLGALLGSRGRVQEARAQLEHAVALNPDYADAHNNLGAMLARMGRLNDAIQQVRLALRLRSDYMDAQDNLRRLMAMGADQSSPQ